ncbi:MAG: hypothetical protein IKU40_08635 [Clostridia bacterium]|nr:hypothetical protein [Clostridia bacterium]
MIILPFGKRVEPFVDDYLIEKTEGVSFRGNTPVNRGKILGFDREWEGPGSLGMTVFQDEENIKLYYRGFPGLREDDTSVMQTSCLMVSPIGDGLNFTSVPVNEIDYAGIRENNIVKMDTCCHNFAPFYDTNPDCKPDERYKAIGGIIQTGGIFVYASPDGIHWKQLTDHPVITKGAFDSMNMAFWDSIAGVYRCYNRYFDCNGAYPEIKGGGARAIQSCVSTDFIHWSEPVFNQYADGITDQLYTNAVRPIPGAEHLLISLPMRFHPSRKKVKEHGGSNAWDFDGASDIVLMTSRNGTFWDRSLKDAWLAGSTYLHEWTERNFITCGGIIEQGDDFLFYTEKNYRWEDDGLWAYSVPRYRFLSLYADGTGGTVLTKPLFFQSDEFYLNFATSAYGSVIVRVLDPDGNVTFTSEEYFGNELSAPVHVDGLAGKTGRLSFELREAHLYAVGSPMKK